jgi:hypothetical protein
MDAPIQKPEDALYDSILTLLVYLRDTRERFLGYSANDIKHLITAKLNGVREPKDLQMLYTLERLIGELRQSFNEAKRTDL